MKLYLLYTRATARGRWHRNANSASLSKHECIAAVYNPTWYQGSSSVESTFQRAAHEGRAYLAVHKVSPFPDQTLRPNRRCVVEDYLLHDNKTRLAKMSYDKMWRLEQGGRTKRITPNRAAALKGAFFAHIVNHPCKRAKLISL